MDTLKLKNVEFQFVEELDWNYSRIVIEVMIGGSCDHNYHAISDEESLTYDVYMFGNTITDKMTEYTVLTEEDAIHCLLCLLALKNLAW